MTVVACVLYFSLNGINREEFVTGRLVEDMNTVLIVDIENAADALGLHDKNYSYYTIPAEDCNTRPLLEGKI